MSDIINDDESEHVAVLTDDVCDWDNELKALVCIVESLAPLDDQTRRRVIRWAVARYMPDRKLEVR